MSRLTTQDSDLRIALVKQVRQVLVLGIKLVEFRLQVLFGLQRCRQLGLTLAPFLTCTLVKLFVLFQRIAVSTGCFQLHA